MIDLINLFKPHISELFDLNTKYVSDEISKIRIDQPNSKSKIGARTARSIVLEFDHDVIDTFHKATTYQQKELKKYKSSLQRLIITRMQDYDPDGDRNTAFKIYIDSRATDL